MRYARFKFAVMLDGVMRADGEMDFPVPIDGTSYSYTAQLRPTGHPAELWGVRINNLRAVNESVEDSEPAAVDIPGWVWMAVDLRFNADWVGYMKPALVYVGGPAEIAGLVRFMRPRYPGRTPTGQPVPEGLDVFSVLISTLGISAD